MLKAPQKQNATDTIRTLASRLASATLLEDRRGAILGLRSFAKHYPASVASSSLRDLIACLRANAVGLSKDVGDGDVDTVRSILETFKMLFEPDHDSPEAGEEIRLFIADEFTQRQDNITILLDLLDTSDYYVRTHSLELLLHVSSARLERTQECILTAPLGTARLVGVLDDGRAAVRLAALDLLVELTVVSQTELQKLIAFEDAFPRIFALIKDDGGILEGGSVVKQCLILLSNLIRHSTSNQSLFRETGCVRELKTLIVQIATLGSESDTIDPVGSERAAWGLLAVVRLFLEPGDLGTKANQLAFWNELGPLILALAFKSNLPPHITSWALLTCSDMILDNSSLQGSFPGLVITRNLIQNPILTNGHNTPPEPTTQTDPLTALLDIILNLYDKADAELRHSACTLIKAYLHGHAQAKHAFLSRAIAGYKTGEDPQINLLSTLMSGPPKNTGSDALRYVFAGDICSQLIVDNNDAKAMLLEISEGNPAKGEDVITAGQAIASHLCTCLSREAEPQISVAYLCFLITLYFDSPDAVNDCLADGSALLGSLVTTASLTKHSQMAGYATNALLPGLCAVLLGVIYEFSSKDSPIPRRTLEPFLVGRLGRQRYFDALLQLRQHPAIRDAELYAHSAVTPSEDDTLFDPSFVDWFKDEYGRLRRVIDRDPGIEILARSHAGVDRDILDELRGQIESKDQALQELEQKQLQTSQHADQLESEHRKEVQSLQSAQRSSAAEVDAIKRVNEALQREHQVELDRLQQDAKTEVERSQKSHNLALQSSQQQHERDIDRIKGQHGASLASERSLWEDKLRRAAEQAARDSETQLEELKASVQERDRALVVSKQDHQVAVKDLEAARDEVQRQAQMIEQLRSDLQKSKDLQAGLQQVNTKALSKVKTIEEESKRNETRSESLAKENDRLTEEKDKLSTLETELREEVQGLKSELAVERKGYGDLEAELERLKVSKDQPNNDLETQLKSKSEEIQREKAETQKARSELEDMLMVMADIEAKRDEYRARLKKAGETVSEDEDEDEDDADDGDDTVD